MRPHMGFHTKIQKRHYTHSISSFCELSIRLTYPPCRSPWHLFPHITYCPEPLSATILSDKNVSKGGEYIMPRGERILSPLRSPFAEGTGACSIPLHLRVSRVGLCVPTCTLLCTRVYTLVYTCVHSSALTERPRGLSPRGSTTSQGGHAADDRRGGEWEDYHSPRLVVSTAWEGEGRLCLRGMSRLPRCYLRGVSESGT